MGERDTAKTGVPDPLNETAGEIDGRGPHRQSEELCGANSLCPEDMTLDVEDVSIAFTG